jgi:hypothetical protein
MMPFLGIVYSGASDPGVEALLVVSPDNPAVEGQLLRAPPSDRLS